MKLTDKQAQLMFMTLLETRNISGGIPFSIDQAGRMALINQILAQQDNTLKELSTKDLTKDSHLG